MKRETGKVFSTLVNTGDTHKILTEDETRRIVYIVESVVRFFGEPDDGILVVYGRPRGTNELIEQFATFVHAKNPNTHDGAVSYTKNTDVLRSCVKNGVAIARLVQEKMEQDKLDRSGVYGGKNAPWYMILDTDDGPLFAMFIMNGKINPAIQEIYCTAIAISLIYLRPDDKTLAKIYRDIMSGGWGALVCLKQINDIVQTKLVDGVVQEVKEH